MKKKNTPFLSNGSVFYAFLMLALMACNSQPPSKADTGSDSENELSQQDPGMLPTATQLITKKWEVAAYNIPDLEGEMLEPGQINTVRRAMDFLFDMQVGDVLVVFDRSNEYVADGSWELSQDTSKLNIVINDEQRSLKVEHFAADRLALSWIETIDNTPLEIQVALKPFIREE